MLITLVRAAFDFYYYLIIARVIMSWVRPQAHNETMRKFFSFIYEATEPVLGPIRDLFPSFGGLDFSPIIALVALQIVRSGVLTLLYNVL